MYHKERHEATPDSIRDVNGLKPHLCSLALYRGKLQPDQCQKCAAGCKYGMRLLHLMGMQRGEERFELRVKDLAVQGQALPTLHQRLKKRKK